MAKKVHRFRPLSSLYLTSFQHNFNTVNKYNLLMPGFEQRIFEFAPSTHLRNLKCMYVLTVVNYNRNMSSGQPYKCSTIVIYDSRVVMARIRTTLESQFSINTTLP